MVNVHVTGVHLYLTTVHLHVHVTGVHTHVHVISFHVHVHVNKMKNPLTIHVVIAHGHVKMTNHQKTRLMAAVKY